MAQRSRFFDSSGGDRIYTSDAWAQVVGAIIGDGVVATGTDGISPDRAVAWLQELSATWRAAEVPAERADVLHAIYDRITIAGRKIVSVRLTPSAYAHGFALALPEKVAVARPTVSDAPDRC